MDTCGAWSSPAGPSALWGLRVEAFLCPQAGLGGPLMLVH